MRLREVQRVLAENVPKLNLDERGAKNATELWKAAIAKAAVEELRKVPGLKDAANAVLKVPLIAATPAGTLSVPHNDNAAVQQLTQLQQGIGRLKEAAALYSEALRESLPEQSDHTVVLELPNDGDFEKVVERLADLQQALSMVGGEHPASVKVQNFDSGSLILEVVGLLAMAKYGPELVTKGAEAFASTVFYLFQVARDALTWRAEIEASVKHVGALGALKDDIDQTKLLNSAVRERIRETLASTGEWKPEELNKLVEVTERLSAQVREGVKVFAANAAPHDIKRLAASGGADLLAAGRKPTKELPEHGTE